jgi:DNA invertase Pin-like site-specific DNA recombinase
VSEKKRVFCLYRVSTKGQVFKDDIPLQKHASREFCDKMGWEIVDTRSEKGVSGFKVSAHDRDAILDIREAALQKKFDILLVYMFDRLGRKEDETPFILEWFVKQGIEVWSVTEGQQKIEQHVDKLMNYIRFWQAQGESEKTSQRVKDAHAMVTEDGHFRGGSVPFGYHLEHRGRVNKRGAPLGDLAVDERESAVVRIIFDRYVNHGYGTLRICNYLADNGMAKRDGGRFTNTTIQNILKRPVYVGVLTSGDARSEVIPELQIIPREVFDRAQDILRERSGDFADRRIPLNTKGNALLSGNVFCGHCGARLTLTTNGKRYVKKNGDVTVTPKTRYVCYNKTRHPEKCDGQTGYTTAKLDGVVETIVQTIFHKIKEKPRDELIAAQFAERIATCKLNLEQAKAALSHELGVLSMLENEIIKVIDGTSVLKPDMLNKKHDEAECAVNEKRAALDACERELAGSEEMTRQVTQQYSNVLTWADMFAGSPMDVKKMITAQLIGAVRVSRDYQIEIDFKISAKQLGLEEETETVREPKQKKRRNDMEL